jgi:hypothetical protein
LDFGLVFVKSHIIFMKLVNYMIFLLVKDAVLFKLSYNLIKSSELYDSCTNNTDVFDSNVI